ncbi:MAG: DUF1073 domain-containing protein [Bacteroidales bacterium]|nr:DUF1073 domain-containing protein [Bacteroidales bacterium]
MVADEAKPQEQQVPLETLSDYQLIQLYYQIPGSLVRRSQLAAKQGSQYDGDRKIYEALGYPTDTLKFSDFYARYERQDMAKAIIDKPVNATWRGGLKIRESGERDGDKETDFEKAYKDLDKRLGLKKWFTRLDKLTGLGYFGVLLLGFNDVKDRKGLMKPIKKGAKLNYVRAFGDHNIEIKTWEENTGNERYGKPLTYQVKITGPHSERSDVLVVHWSRLIHVIDGALESQVYGTPRLRAIYNRLMDLEKVAGGDAEMFWRGARPGYVGSEQEGFELTPAQREQIQAQIKDYEHNMSRFMITKGLDINQLQQQVADPGNHVDVLVQMISAETGIPKRILVGSERGELASTEDRTQWLSEITTRREEFAEETIVRPFVDKCVELGILPAPKNEDYDVVWEDLFAPSNKEKAEIGNIRSEALMYYARYPYASEILPVEQAFELLMGMTKEEIDKAMQEGGDNLAEELKSIKEQFKSRPTGTSTEDPKPDKKEE